MRDEDYYKKLEEVKALFSEEFLEKIRSYQCPIHSRIFDALMHNTPVYTLLEKLCDNMEDLHAKFTEHLKYGAPPVYIGRISDEMVKEMNKITPK